MSQDENNLHTEPHRRAEPGTREQDELTVVNPDPCIGRFEITADQLRALRLKYQQNPDDAASFAQFKGRARPAGTGSDRYVMLPWCGMWLGIEPDGYTHS